MDILFNLNSAMKKQKILYPWAGALKAGTPLAYNGAVANGSSAIGLVAQDYPEEWAKEIYPDGKFYAEVEVITEGYIDLAAAEANFGLTYSDDLKAALTGIVFCDGALPAPDVLPAIEAGDAGKVLTVGASSLEWDEIDDPLPTPTTEGAVLEVGSVADPSVVILPEQTVEFDEEMNGYIPVGGTPSVLEEGLKVCVTVNGTSQIVSVTTDSGGTSWGFGETGLWYVLEEEPNFWIFSGDYDGEPVTISVMGIKLEWGEDPFGDYDIVVRSSDSALSTISADELTLVKGGYLAALERAKKGLPIRCYAYYAGHSIDAQTGDDIYVVNEFTVSHQLFSNDRYEGEFAFYIAGTAINPTHYGLVYINPQNIIGYQYH